MRLNGACWEKKDREKESKSYQPTLCDFVFGCGCRRLIGRWSLGSPTFVNLRVTFPESHKGQHSPETTRFLSWSLLCYIFIIIVVNETLLCLNTDHIHFSQ